MLSQDQIKVVYSQISNILDQYARPYNFQVAKAYPLGRPAPSKDGSREFRLQLVNTQLNTAEALKAKLIQDLQKVDGIANIMFNPLSPNSSKYPSISFTWGNTSRIKFDVVIAKGANKGENFEKKVVSDLQSYFSQASIKDSYVNLINKLSKANPQFAFNEMASVKQRTGSTQKEGVPVEKLGAIIGDIVIKDAQNKEWYISLKDVNGDTFSSYSGAASLFDSQGTLQDKSAGAEFLLSFGVDLDKVQQGFDARAKKVAIRPPCRKAAANSEKIKAIFQRAWGMNYFYVRKQTNGWKVFWLDSAMLNKLTSGIQVKEIRYPSDRTKQITILCGNNSAQYSIEFRNSKGGEYPNDIKFKVGSLNL